MQHVCIEKVYGYAKHNREPLCCAYNEARQVMLSIDSSQARSWTIPDSALASPEGCVQDLGTFVFPPRTSNYILACIYLPTKNMYVCSALDGQLLFFNSRLQLLHSVFTHLGLIYCFAFDPHRDHLITGGIDGLYAWTIHVPGRQQSTRGEDPGHSTPQPPQHMPKRDWTIETAQFDVVRRPNFFHLPPRHTSTTARHSKAAQGSTNNSKFQENQKKAKRSVVGINHHSWGWMHSIQIQIINAEHVYVCWDHVNVDIYHAKTGHFVARYTQLSKTSIITKFTVDSGRTNYLLLGTQSGEILVITMALANTTTTSGSTSKVVSTKSITTKSSDKKPSHCSSSSNNWTLLATLSGHVTKITGVMVHDPSTYGLTASIDGVIKIWDLDVFREMYSLSLNHPIHHLLSFPSSRPRARLVCSGQTSINVYELGYILKQHHLVHASVLMLDRHTSGHATSIVVICANFQVLYFHSSNQFESPISSLVIGCPLVGFHSDPAHCRFMAMLLNEDDTKDEAFHEDRASLKAEHRMVIYDCRTYPGVLHVSIALTHSPAKARANPLTCFAPLELEPRLDCFTNKNEVTVGQEWTLVFGTARGNILVGRISTTSEYLNSSFEVLSTSAGHAPYAIQHLLVHAHTKQLLSIGLDGCLKLWALEERSVGDCLDSIVLLRVDPTCARMANDLPQVYLGYKTGQMEIIHFSYQHLRSSTSSDYTESNNNEEDDEDEDGISSLDVCEHLQLHLCATLDGKIQIRNDQHHVIRELVLENPNEHKNDTSRDHFQDHDSLLVKVCFLDDKRTRIWCASHDCIYLISAEDILPLWKQRRLLLQYTAKSKSTDSGSIFNNRIIDNLDMEHLLLKQPSHWVQSRQKKNRQRLIHPDAVEVVEEERPAPKEEEARPNHSSSGNEAKPRPKPPIFSLLAMKKKKFSKRRTRKWRNNTKTQNDPPPLDSGSIIGLDGDHDHDVPVVVDVWKSMNEEIQMGKMKSTRGKILSPSSKNIQLYPPPVTRAKTIVENPHLLLDPVTVSPGSTLEKKSRPVISIMKKEEEDKRHSDSLIYRRSGSGSSDEIESSPIRAPVAVAAIEENAHLNPAPKSAKARAHQICFSPPNFPSQPQRPMSLSPRRLRLWGALGAKEKRELIVARNTMNGMNS